jgi:uncharacterized iron-regulated protein
MASLTLPSLMDVLLLNPAAFVDGGKFDQDSWLRQRINYILTLFILGIYVVDDLFKQVNEWVLKPKIFPICFVLRLTQRGLAD